MARQTTALRDNERLEREKAEQRLLIQTLQEAQEQLLQSEKLASIGQLAAGVAHGINKPVGYISSSLSTLEDYAGSLMRLIDMCVDGERGAYSASCFPSRGRRQRLPMRQERLYRLPECSQL